MKYRVGILGSTGSIGKNSLEVIRNLRRNNVNFEVIFLSTNINIKLLQQQCEEFNPKSIFINDKEAFKNAVDSKSFKCAEILNGENSLNELVSRDNYDILLNSFVGFAGTLPTIEAIKSGKRIALANKETMVVAGKLINELCSIHNCELIPIDSEHSAIFQCLMGENTSHIKKIILTASGGPFRGFSYERLNNVTLEQALKHPNWSMGSKITIDSATLMNKGLELIEAKWLFNVDPKLLDVIIHPQSIIHSMVEFNDTSVKSQLGLPDMKVPIQLALTYPERINNNFQSLDFLKSNRLDFEKPDLGAFKCLKLAYDVINSEGTYSTVLNASNEIAVDLFLKGKIKFNDIPEIIEKSLSKHTPIMDYSIDDIVGIDLETRRILMEEYF